jgi:hypothetical protein
LFAASILVRVGIYCVVSESLALYCGRNERRVCRWGLSSLAMSRRGVQDVTTSDSATRSRVRRAAFAGIFNVAEVMAVRPEDKNARQVQQAFANGATLVELEQHLAFLRSLGAPDDAHPRVGVNEDYEVTMMICVVRRPTLQASSPS